LKRRGTTRTLWGASLLLAGAACLSGEIIDRIAVSVGNRVITAGDIEREIRVTALQNGTPPDLSREGKRAAAERMIEQKLVRRELETSRYPTPDPSEAIPILDDFKRRNFKSEEEYRRALQRYGVTEQDLKDEILWQRTMMVFLEVRFRADPDSDQERSDRELNAWLREARKRTEIVFHEEAFE
jgi:hypothetical protein